ncbi:MAG: ORF6N domain-containing protein [Proteobacteria bacterium]|nr:ORF6N domain-containing protein [Pseudomonadota bacterium]
MGEIIPIENIKPMIHMVRGHKVMLDSDLAELYAVEVRVLNQAVKRNIKRFPADFMFQLTKEEWAALRSQIVILGGVRRYRPFVFAEQGIAMLSGVLNSDRAIEVNIGIMRAFVEMRKFLISNKEITERIDRLERKHDKQFTVVFDALRSLLEPPQKEPPKIGFKSTNK